MTSRERIYNAVHRKGTDCVPVAPYMGNFGTVAAGFALGDCYKDGITLAKAQLAAWELFGSDTLVIQSDNYYMAEAFGSKIRYYEDSTPTLESPAVKEIGDIAALTPADPDRDGRMHVYLEAVEYAAKQAGQGAAIRGCGTGPFVMAGHLMGNERMLLELANTFYGNGEHDEAFHHLLMVSCETLIAFVTRQLELGATIIQLADSTASLDMISPEMYEKYVLPVEKHFFRRVNPICREYDAVSLLHICGNNTKIFPQIRETGAMIFEVDHKSDIGEARRVMGDRLSVIGNLDPTGVLLQGSPELVRKKAEECIRKAASPEGGFILGSGCEVPIHTPHENIRAMIETARAYSWE